MRANIETKLCTDTVDPWCMMKWWIVDECAPWWWKPAVTKSSWNILQWAAFLRGPEGTCHLKKAAHSLYGTLLSIILWYTLFHTVLAEWPHLSWQTNECFHSDVLCESVTPFRGINTVDWFGPSRVIWSNLLHLWAVTCGHNMCDCEGVGG